MKKRLSSMILALVFCLSSLGFQTAFASTTGYNYSTAKMVTLFGTQYASIAGNASGDWLTLNAATDVVWSIANTDATGIIIIPNPNSISTLGTTSTNYSNLGTSVANCANQLLSKNPNLSIWIGTPSISSSNYTSITSSTESTYLNLITNSYIATVYSALTSSGNWSKVKGVYYNQEAVYGTVSSSNIYSNYEIKLMNDVSYRVHNTYSKDMLWIPYYGHSFTYNGVLYDYTYYLNKIAYIANTSNIFDCVILQSSYISYADTESLSNFSGITSSVTNQSIRNRSGSVICTKTSNTVIGAEYEYIGNATNFTQYTNYYSGYPGTRACAFYWGNIYASAAAPVINGVY